VSSTELVRVRRHFLVLAALRWFPVGLVVPVLVLLLRARGLDLTTIAVLMSAYSITTALFELPTGGLADVIGRRPVLVAASLLFAGQSVLLGLGQSLPVLALGAVVGGLGRALDSGPLHAWYVDAVHAVDRDTDLKPGLARAEAVEAGALGIGALAGGALVTVAPLDPSGATVLSLSVPFLASAGLCLVHSIALLRWVHEPARSRRPALRSVLTDVPRTIRTGVALVARRGALRRVVILTVCLGVTLGSVELIAPVSFAHLLGGEDAAAGPFSVLVTLAFLGTAAGSSLAPGIARLLRSSARGIMAARLCAGVAVVGLAAPSFAVAAGAYVVLYLLLGVSGPLSADITHRSVGAEHRATILSVQSLTLQLSGVTAGLTLGPLAQHVSFLTAYVVIGAVLVLGASACIRMPVPAPPGDRPLVTSW
jgi:MFS family permease